MRNIKITVHQKDGRFIPTGQESRELRQWEPDVKFADRKPLLDEFGNALYAFPAVLELHGEKLGEVEVQSPQPLPEKLELLTVLNAVGDSELTISNKKDQYDLGITLRITGFEQAHA